MNHKYGTFSSEQIHETKLRLQKQIFFLLLLADPNTKNEHIDKDINKAFDDLMFKISGLNSLLLEPPELVMTICYLEMARSECNIEYTVENFKKSLYRKNILDAGAEIMKVKEV